MTDEAGGLRAALEHGDWQRLTDPLLVPLLLMDPGPWWRRASVACALALVSEASTSLPRTCPPALPRFVLEGWLEAWHPARAGRAHDWRPWVGSLLRVAQRQGVAVAALGGLQALPSDCHAEAARGLAGRLVGASEREDLDDALAVLERWPAG